MQIPIGSSGFATLSPTQLRTYGVGGFLLDVQEEPRGCPRQYKAKYVDHVVSDEGRPDMLRYGSMVHDALYLMEQGLTPEEALERAFPVDMDPSFFSEAKADLESYLSRGSMPRDRYATLAVELDLAYELYVDEVFGPVWMRGIIDWIGVDPEFPSVLHVVDYKTNRQPPSTADVKGDVQLKTYHWLAARWAREVGIESPQVVVHLDAIKFREVEVRYGPRAIEDWEDWAVAMARKILRDTEAEPKLNPDCAYCPVKGDCPAYQSLPDVARVMATGLPVVTSDEDLVLVLQWRDAANKMRLLLDKAVKAADAAFRERATLDGRLLVGDTEFVLEPDWKTVTDLESLHRVLGDRFYDAVTASKARIEEVTADDPSARAAALACLSRVPEGMAVSRRKVEVTRA